MTKVRMSQKLSLGLFIIPIICLLLTCIIILIVFQRSLISVGVPVELPKTTSKILESDPPVIITISKDGRLFLNDLELEQFKIPKELLSKLRNKRIYLRADKKVEYGKVIEVYGQLNKENIRISLVVEHNSSDDKKPTISNTSRKSLKNISPPSRAISEKISSKTIAKIRDHVAKCWSINPGFSDLKNSIILKIYLNEDMSVSKVEVKDKENYLNNRKYRVLADSAKRAVLACSPLPLDNSNHVIFKEFEMEFKSNL